VQHKILLVESALQKRGRASKRGRGKGGRSGSARGGRSRSTQNIEEACSSNSRSSSNVED
jgi:hypothetical protein